MEEQTDSKKTILITGGAGFVGSHLCKKYVDLGHTVYCVDNLQTTNSTRNIDELLMRRNFHFIRHDITKPLPVKARLDWIFNFACSGSYTSYQFDPVHTTKTNTIGVINALELARKSGARIMQASTSEIYGNPLESPQKESYTGNVNILGPRACYDEGKRCAETLFMDYHREYGVDIKIIRIFNTYGPNMDVNDGRAVSNFLTRALVGDDLVVYGDGSQTRSFQYIDDLVEGIDRMMRADDFTGPVNLGNPEELTVKDLAERAVKFASSKSKIVYTNPATDDPQRRRPDIALAKEKLGWEPRVSVDEGLKKTIGYFKTIERPDQRILVFATTYYPDLGPAEHALHDLSQEMRETEFHIITSRFKPGRSSVESLGKDTVYRIGFGSTFDKYLLPFLGFWLARKLQRKHHYRFVWSVLASYGALAALFLKLASGKINFLLSFDGSEERNRSARKSWFLLPAYRMIFRHADSIFISDISLEERAKMLSGDREISVISPDTKSFMNQVRYRYARLINQQERKLDRAK